MEEVFDICAAISEAAAAFANERGISPDTCFVSREIYRVLVEKNAADHAIGNLIIGSFAVGAIVTRTAQLRVIIDENLNGCELSVG